MEQQAVIIFSRGIPMIRRLTSAELDDMFALSQFAFQFELTKDELEKSKKREDPALSWGYFKDGHLAANMKIFPLEVYIHERVFAMGGVAGVATWPEYRRQGMVKQLLSHGLKVMKDAGQSVSFLYPFSFSYYRKYGWEHIVDRKKYMIKREQLPRFRDDSGRVERKQSDALPLLKQIYEEYGPRYNGPLKRSDDWWLHHTALSNKKSTIAVYFDEMGRPRGYMVYRVMNKEMKIDEIIHLDESTRRGLWQFIANHDSMIDQVTLIAPTDDTLPFLLPDPRIGQELLPYFMGRIVDAKSFLQQYPFQEGGVKRLVLSLQDPVAPWNQGRFELRFERGGQTDVRVYEQNQSDTPEGVECDIQTLAAMLLSDRRPTTLHESDRLTGDSQQIRQWEQIIPRKTPYFPDFF